MTPDSRRFWRTVGIATALVLTAVVTLQALGLDEAHGSTATTDECDRTIGANVPAVSSAAETGDDTPTDVGLPPDAAGVGGGQRPATASAAEPVSAPTANELVALPEVQS